MGQNKSVPQFKEITSLVGTDLFHIVSNNVDKKMTYDNLLIQIEGDLTDFVHLTGDENIDGVKTFSSSPKVPYAPADDDSAVNKEWVLDQIGTASGNISGTLNDGYYPVSNGTHSLTNGRIRQTTNQLFVESPDTNTYLRLENDNIYFNSNLSGGGAVLELGLGVATIVGYEGFLQFANDKARIGHNVLTDFDSLNYRFSQLDANSAVYLDSNKDVRTLSTVTPTKLGFLSNVTSDIQVQINSIYAGISWKDEVKAATIGNITLSGTQTVDTVALIVDDHCLVKNQTSAWQNGIYVVKSGAWVRRTDADATSEIVKATVGVRLGSQKDTWWSCNNTNEPVIGVDSINFVQVPGAGATYSAGTGINISGGFISIADNGVTNVKIADNTINLSTKVTSVLKYANGGTGNSAIPTTGALPYGGATSYLYDFDNYNYDPVLKRLNANKIFLTPEDGFPGLEIEGAGNGIVISAFDGNYDALIVSAKGNGVKVDSESGTAGIFTSSEYAGEFNQKGIITADVDFPGLTINRNFTRPASGTGSSAKCTGPTLLITDTTTPAMGTGSGIKYIKNNSSGVPITKFEVTPDGRTSYTVQDAVKVSASGTIFSITSGSATTGATATDIFSSTIKGSTLSANGDEIYARYYFGLNETVKTKTITVSFAGTTLFTSPTFALVAAGGRGSIDVSIMRTVASNAISYYVEMRAYENGTSTTLAEYSFLATGSPNLAVDNILKVTATCQAGSADGGVVGLHGKIILNPNN